MKKRILFGTFVLAGLVLLSFSSCKKDYTCDCVITTSATGVPPSTTTVTTVFNATKSDAKSDCDAMDKPETTVYGVTQKTECEIK